MTLERELGENEYILEQSVDGMELSACARFWCALCLPAGVAVSVPAQEWRYVP